MFYCGTKNGSSIASLRVFKESEEYKIKVFSNLAHLECSTAWYGTVRFSTVHFWGVFHWLQYLVPDTFLVPPRPGFQAILVC